MQVNKLQSALEEMEEEKTDLRQENQAATEQLAPHRATHTAELNIVQRQLAAATTRVNEAEAKVLTSPY